MNHDIELLAKTLVDVPEELVPDYEKLNDTEKLFFASLVPQVKEEMPVVINEYLRATRKEREVCMEF
jgi:hypothetical protein